MPQIRQFNAPALGLEPTETGIRATTDAARRAGASFNEVAQESEAVGNRFARGIGTAVQAAGDQVVAYAEHREIAHGAAAWAGLNDQLTQQWNDIAKNADPNDPTVAAKFRENVLEPALEKYRDGFLTEGGQKFAESHVERLRDHMFQKTAADMSSLAAKAVEVNVRTTANSLSNTAMTDPSAVPHLISSVDGMVGDMVGSSPNIKGAESAKVRLDLTERMKEQIVKAGAIGAIQRSANPEATAAEWGAKYPDYVNGAELKQLGTIARAQQRVNLLTEKQLAAYQKQQAQEGAHQELSKIWTDNVSFDDNGKPTIKPGFYKSIMDAELKFPGAASERARALINWGQAQQRERHEVITTDQTVMSRLMTDMFDPNKDKREIEIEVLKAEAEHKLDAHDGSVLRGLSTALEGQSLKGPIYQTALDGAKERLGFSLMADGHERYANFMATFWPQYLQMKKAGTLPPNALDLKDEKSLIRQAAKPYEPDVRDRFMAHTMKQFGGVNPGGGSIGSPPPTVKTKEDFDRLPSGAAYIGKDGKTYRKP